MDAEPTEACAGVGSSRDPARLGSYRLLRRLGAGAMGTVHLAEDEDGARVAIKLLHPHLLERRGFFKRFRREARAGGRVDHPNVVRTLDSDLLVIEGTACCFLVMEYVQGRTLREMLRERSTLPEALVREIGRQVAAGLTAIHAAGIVHRDLKPENVLITDDHRVRIMDLGVARHTEVVTELTREGQFTGSLLYAAPEQLRGNPVGPAADLYALGVMLYELLSGTNPFRHDDPGAVITAHLESVPDRVDRRTGEVSVFLSELVATLLAKRAEERFEDAITLAEVLARGERSAWWTARERQILRERERRPKVPVRRETRLYGRETELTLCREAWRQAKSGHGNTLLLEGEAGIGKSRLVDAFLGELDPENAHVLYGSYPPSGGMGGISDAILTRFGRADLEESVRPYLTITPSLVPAFAAVVKRETAPETAAQLQGDALHAVCVHFMRALAHEKPLLWVVEDLHFADSDSRKLLLSLARAVEGHSVLLLATTRPGIPEAELAHFGRIENFRRASVGRLSAREVVLLLQDAFRSEMLAEKLGVRIALHSDGIPFFIFEMIRGLKAGQFITQLPDGSWIESKVIEKIEVPRAVQELIHVRLKDLRKEERAILDVGAVVGFEFDPDLMAAVLERESVAVLQDLAEIERHTGVVRGVGNLYRFDHHQIQEVVYADLSRRLKQEYHRLLAEAYASQVQDELSGEDHVFLAWHHLRGSRPKSALVHLTPALGQLASCYRHEVAIELATLALQSPGLLNASERIETLLHKSEGHKHRAERSDERTCLQEARALACEVGDARTRSRVCLSLGSFHGQGSENEAQPILEEALVWARTAGDSKLVASAINNLGIVHKQRGRLSEAQAHHERAVALSRELQDRWGEARANMNLAVDLQEAGEHVAAMAHIERSRALYSELGDRKGEGIACANLGLVFYRLGRYAEACEHCERAQAIHREIGCRWAEAVTHVNLGTLLVEAGSHAEALERLQHARALCREIGDRQGESIATENLGAVLGRLGRKAEEEKCLTRSLVLFRETGNRMGEALGQSNFGAFLVGFGRHAEARDHLQRSLALSREIGDRRSEAYALQNLASIAEDESAVEMACRLYKQALDLRRKLGEKTTIAKSLMSLARVEAMSNADVLASVHLEEAHALARETQRRDILLEAALLRAQLQGGQAGAALAAFGQHEERVSHGARMSARFHLWELTEDKAHLTEAKRLLDFAVEHAPEEYRTSMLENVPLHRDIMRAWEEHGDKDAE